jgi:hypothetical protein
MSAEEDQLTEHLARIESMTNVELCAELTTGNKKDLLPKLRQVLVKPEEIPVPAASTK